MENQNAEQLINSINREYYVQKIESLRKQKLNLKMGNDRYAGTGIKKSSKPISPRQAELEIKMIESEIEDLEQKRREMEFVQQTLQNETRKMERLVQESELTNKLATLLEYRNDNQTQKELKNARINTRNKISDSTQKIEKDMYKLLKDNKKLKVNNLFTIASKFSHSQYGMNTIFEEMQIEMTDDYIKGSKSLELDNARIRRAIDAMNGEINQDNINFRGRESLSTFYKLNSFVNQHYNLESKESALVEKLHSNYKEIMEQSREIWYLDELIDIFKNTSISKSQLYQSMCSVKEQQISELRSLISTSEQQYENSGLKGKIEASARIVALQKQIEFIKQEMLESRENQQKYEQLQSQYLELKSTLVQLLEKYPELNKNRINIKTEILREQLKNEYKSKEEQKEKEIQLEDKQQIKNIKKEILRDQLKNEYEPKEEHQEKEIQLEDKQQIKNIELDENLQIQRTQLYQQYMVEKVKNTDLGKMPFSEYLKVTRPNSRELIEIEQSRENMANIIYDEYLKYYELLDDKTTAMSFEQFANNKYGVENVDIPIAYEENYREIRKK